MPVLAWAALIMLSEGAPPAPGQVRPVQLCPDTLALHQQFLDGEIEEVYGVWQNYFRASRAGLAGIENNCFASGIRTMSVLNLRLPSQRDTDQALSYWYTLLKLRPRVEMWDLWLPMETQTYWDDFRLQIGRPRTEPEIWADRWLPPIDTTPPGDAEALTLRKNYHRNRLLYGNAGVDAENYYRIMENIRTLHDPTFDLFRTDIMLRLGMNVVQSREELDKFRGQHSKVMRESDMVEWCTRLSGILKEREQSVEPNDSARIESHPKVNTRIILSKRKRD